MLKMSSHCFFAALDSILAQLHSEFKQPIELPTTYAERLKLISLGKPLPSGGESIPVVSSKRSEGSSKGSSSGVNHLNLIQIKGRAAHSWQPVYIQTSTGESFVNKPSLSTVDVNSMLLKAFEAKKL